MPSKKILHPRALGKACARGGPYRCPYRGCPKAELQWKIGLLFELQRINRWSRATRAERLLEAINLLERAADALVLGKFTSESFEVMAIRSRLALQRHMGLPKRSRS